MTQKTSAISKSRAQWNRLANQWERQTKDINNKFTKRTYLTTEFIERNKIHPCTTLDLGCANGLISSILANKGFSTYGIDVSDELIRLAIKRLSANFNDVEDRFRVCYNDEIPFNNRSFKLVTMIGVLPYIKNQKEYIKNIYNMIETDGYFLASSANRCSIYVFLYILKHILMIRPTKLWWDTLINLSRTGINSGGNLEHHSSTQVHSASQFDRLFNEIGFNVSSVLLNASLWRLDKQ